MVPTRAASAAASAAEDTSDTETADKPRRRAKKALSLATVIACFLTSGYPSPFAWLDLPANLVLTPAVDPRSAGDDEAPVLGSVAEVTGALARYNTAPDKPLSPVAAGRRRRRCHALRPWPHH